VLALALASPVAPAWAAGETAPANDIHFHPVEPRSARFTIQLKL